MTTVKEIVQTLQAQFQGYANQYSDDSMYHGNPFTKFESEKAVRDLVTLLSARTNDEQEADETTLAFLIEFLESRWNAIQATQSMYNHSPLTLANRLCLDVAKQISAVTQVSRYAYLYPSIKDKLAAYESEKGKIDVLEPWEFVFDAQWNPVDVLLALKLVIARPDMIANHTDLALRGEKIDLETSVRVFTSHANFVCWAYNPENRQDNAIVIPDKLSAEEVAHYDNCSYGEAGLLRQSEMMGLGSLDKFARMLAIEYEKLQKLKLGQNDLTWRKLWKDEWCKIWKTFVTPAIRKQLISESIDAAFYQKLESPTSYIRGDLTYNRAVLFCFVSYYIDDRIGMPEYKNVVTQTIMNYQPRGFSGFFNTATGKEKKLRAAEHFIDFLTSNLSLDKFQFYLSQDRLEEHLPAVNQGMLTNENLPRIVKQASVIMSPKFFPAEEEKPAPQPDVKVTQSEVNAVSEALAGVAAEERLNVMGGQSNFFQPERPPQPDPRPVLPAQPAQAKSIFGYFGW